MNTVESSLNKLDIYCREQGWRGYDPYDALNSSFLRKLSFDTKYGRIALIQLLKRMPFNLRPCLGIKKGHNPKGLGLFLWGYAKLWRIEKKPDYLEIVDHLLDLLAKLRSPGYSGYCWGYNFDWQSRSFYLPRYTPTIVNSAFIGHALLDTYRYTDRAKALDMAVSIKDFILKDLNRTPAEQFFCFSYSPLDRTRVHNANLLGSSLLMRIYKHTGDQVLKETAIASLGFSLKHQREDGSWSYAESHYQRWIDSFHTGFNLQALMHFLEEGQGQECRSALEKGLKFYRKNFFYEDGTPKYYHDRTYPVDIHSSAQAVVVFSRLGSSYKEIKDSVTLWMISHLQAGNGRFYFQKHPWYTNRVPYMRWSQAWAFHALTENLLYPYKEKPVGICDV